MERITDWCLFSLSIFFPLYCHQEWISQLVVRGYQYFYLILSIGCMVNYTKPFQVEKLQNAKIISSQDLEMKYVKHFAVHHDQYEWDVIRADPKYQEMTAIVYLDKKPYVIKRVKKVSWIRKIFGFDKLVASWNHAHQALIEGVSVIRPVALIENRFYTFLIMKFEGQNAKRLSEMNLLYTPAITELLNGLWQSRFIHADLSLENILITQEGAKLIDLEYLHRYPRRCLAEKERWKREYRRLLEGSLEQTAIELSFYFKGNDTKRNSDIEGIFHPNEGNMNNVMGMR